MDDTCKHEGLRQFLQATEKYVQRRLLCYGYPKDAIVTFYISNTWNCWTYDKITYNLKDAFPGCQSPVIFLNGEELHSFSSYHTFWNFVNPGLHCLLCTAEEESEQLSDWEKALSASL